MLEGKLLRGFSCINAKPELAIQDLCNLQIMRLKSHKAFWGSANVLSDAGFNTKGKWHNASTDNNTETKELVSDPTEEPPGLDLPWRQWSMLHRIGTIHARHHTTITNGFQIQPIMRLWLPTSGYSSHCE